MPSPGVAISRTCPVPTAERSTPEGPCTSTTRRPARWRLKVRVTSASICVQATSEMGASSRCRLFIRTFSFKRTNTERAIAHAFGRRFRGRFRRSRRSLRRILTYIVQKVRRRHKKQIARYCATEIQNPVVIAWRTADEHVLQHFFNRIGRAAVADKVSPKLSFGNPAEGHVVAKDLNFFTILLDGRERVVCRRRLDGVVQFDVGQLRSSDDALLRLG